MSRSNLRDGLLNPILYVLVRLPLSYVGIGGVMARPVLRGCLPDSGRPVLARLLLPGALVWKTG